MLARDAYKVEIYKDGKVIKRIATSDVDRIIAACQLRWPTCTGKKVGHKCTRASANRWMYKTEIDFIDQLYGWDISQN